MYLMVDFVYHEGGQCISWLASCITRKCSVPLGWLRVPLGWLRESRKTRVVHGSVAASPCLTRSAQIPHMSHCGHSINITTYANKFFTSSVLE